MICRFVIFFFSYSVMCIAGGSSDPCPPTSSCSSSTCLPHRPCVSNETSIRQKRESDDVMENVLKIETNCNNEPLREIIIQNTSTSTSSSKRLIQREAERVFGGGFNVICARGDFSYIATTVMFCQQTVADITCFAFKQLASQG